MDEAAFRELVSGNRRGAWAGALRGLLHAASVPYGLAVAARNLAYDLGLLRVHAASVFVISVGNLTAGGTGKTPLVAWLAQCMTRGQIPIALLSRGYRSLDNAKNDERLVLDQLCPGVPHLQHPDRVASARRACTEFGAKALILDDGFQHRRLGRTLDVVLIDALNPWGYGYLLPRGLLREPRRNLRRADFVIITRADACSDSRLEDLRREIRQLTSAPVAEVAFVPTRLINVAGQSAPLERLHGTKVAAFCGVGNPAAFEQTLKSAHAEIKTMAAFPDHHHYTAADLDHLGAAAANAEMHVTTQKDLVKLRDLALGGKPLWALEIAAEFRAGQHELEHALVPALTRALATNPAHTNRGS